MRTLVSKPMNGYDFYKQWDDDKSYQTWKLIQLNPGVTRHLLYTWGDRIRQGVEYSENVSLYSRKRYTLGLLKGGYIIEEREDNARSALLYAVKEPSYRPAGSLDHESWGRVGPNGEIRDE